MKIKKIVGAALMLSLSIGILACVPENKSNAYNEDKENPSQLPTAYALTGVEAGACSSVLQR